MIKWIKYNEITPLQLLFIIPGVQIGVGVLSLYGDVFSAGAGHDAWISVILSGFTSQIGVFFIVKLCSYYPKDTLFQFSQKLLGKPLGILLSILITLYFILSAAFILRTYVIVLKIWEFPKTPNLVLIILLLIPAFYVARNGLKVVARFTEATFLLTAWIIVLLVFPLKFGDLRNLLPVGEVGVKPILTSSLAPAFALIGYELIYILYPFTIKKNKILLMASLGNWLTVLTYTIVSLVSAAFFSTGDTTTNVYTTLQMLLAGKTSIIERFEAVVLAFWVLVTLVTIIGYLWGGSLGLYSLLPIKDFKVNVIIASVLILILSPLPQTQLQVKTVVGYIGYAGLLIGVFLPVPLLLLAKLFSKGT